MSSPGSIQFDETLSLLERSQLEEGIEPSRSELELGLVRVLFLERRISCNVITDLLRKKRELGARGRHLLISDMLVQEGHLNSRELAALVERMEEQRKHSSSFELDAVPTRIGNHEILREIGKGGMGIVYEAVAPGGSERLAIKLLPRRPGLRTEQIDRFHREVKIAAGLEHPNIVGVKGFGMDPQLGVFMVMELLTGEPFSDSLRRGHDDLHEPLKILMQVIDAVAYAHAHGVIHRDLKPSNIHVSPQGKATVMDFGLARLTAEEDTTITHTGQILGTPVYMSPEQAAGNFRRVDARTDQYSLGAILYRIITGKNPVEGESATEIYRKILEEEPAPPRLLRPALPRNLEIVCQKAMEKDPALRYASVREMGDDLAAYLAGEAIRARPVSWLRRTRSSIRRHRVALTLIPVSVVALLLAGYLLYGPAIVELQVDPPEARLRVNGEVHAGRKIIWPPGRVVFEVSAPGYRTVRRSFRARPGQRYNDRIQLVRDVAYLMVESRPRGAAVFIDGVDTGRLTPTSRLELRPGSHVVQLRLDGYRPSTREVELELGKDRSLEMALTPRTGLLVLDVEPRQATCTASALAPGSGHLRFTGEAGVRLRQGAYRVEVSAPGHRTVVFTTAIDEGTRRHALSLVPWTRPVWTRQLAGALSAGPFLCDVDGDGLSEILVAVGRGGLVLYEGRTGKPLWSRKVAAAPLLSGAVDIRDIEMDGRPEVIVVEPGRGLALYSARTGLPRGRVAAAGVHRLLEVVDLDGDLTLDFLLALAGGRGVRAVSGKTGQQLWERELVGLPAVCDLTGNGKLAVVAGTPGGAFSALAAATGKELWTLTARYLWGTRSIRRCIRVQAADLDGDGETEIFPIWERTRRWPHYLDGRTNQGKRFRRLRFLTPPLGPLVFVPLVRRDEEEFEGGASDAVVMVSGGMLSAYDLISKTPLWKYRTRTVVSPTPALVEFTGDGIPDLVVAVEGGVYVGIDGKSGAEVWSHRVGGDASGLVAVAGDLDGDGRPEVVLPSTRGLSAITLRASATAWTYSGRAAPLQCGAPGGGKERGSARHLVVAEGDRITAVSTATGIARVLGAAPGRPVTPPVWADLDDDGEPDAVVVTDRTVEAMEGRTGRLLWARPLPEGGLAPPLLERVGGNMSPDVILVGSGLWIIDGSTGNLLLELPRLAGPGSSRLFPVGLFDVDGDGRREVLLWRAGGELSAVRTTDGKVLWKAVTLQERPGNVAAGRVGGRSVIVTGASTRGLSIVDAALGVVQHVPLGRGLVTPPVLGEFSRRGSPEVIAGTDRGEILFVDPARGKLLRVVHAGRPVLIAPVVVERSGGPVVFVSFRDSIRLLEPRKGDRQQAVWTSRGGLELVHAGTGGPSRAAHLFVAESGRLVAMATLSGQSTVWDPRDASWRLARQRARLDGFRQRFRLAGGRAATTALVEDIIEFLETEPAPAVRHAARALLGAAHLSRGEAEKAVSALNQAIEKGWRSPGAYLDLAGAALQLKQTDDAALRLGQYMTREPSRALGLLAEPWPAGMGKVLAEAAEAASGPAATLYGRILVQLAGPRSAQAFADAVAAYARLRAQVPPDADRAFISRFVRPAARRLQAAPALLRSLLEERKVPADLVKAIAG